MDAKKRLQVLHEDWKYCTRCGLHKERGDRATVFGLGSHKAPFLVVYEAPSADDVLVSGPMSGQEGDLFLDLLSQADVPLQNIYCTGLMACRPTTVLPETEDRVERIVDREATKEELQACSPRLRELIYILDPRIIFTLGDLPWKTLVKAKDRGVHRTLVAAMSAEEIFYTYQPGRIMPEVRYDVIPLPSMKQILAQPSSAPHGLLQSTIRQLQRGKAYVEYCQKTERHDAKVAGYSQEDSP